jgi:hypothetical protein
MTSNALDVEKKREKKLKFPSGQNSAEAQLRTSRNVFNEQ